MTEHIWIPGDFQRDNLLEPRNGEHVWIAAAVFRVSAESLRANCNASGEPMGVDSTHLDHENLTGVEVGCYTCEQPFTVRLSYRKCPGEPRD
jgi:hypothetical protein